MAEPEATGTLSIAGRKLVRRPPPGDADRAVRLSSDLPADLEERGARRLGAMAAVIAAVGGIEGVISHGVELVNRADYPLRQEVVDLVGVGVVLGVSALAYALLRSSRYPTALRLKIGFTYLICIAFLVSFIDHSDYFWEAGHRLHGVASLSLIILIVPVIVPMRWQRALALGAAMAATGPLALMALSGTLGYGAPHAGAYVDAAPWLAVLVAAYLARVVHQLGMSLKEARQLGAYRLTERIGGGGMGEVWRAEHQLLARPAAVKLIRPDLEDASPSTSVERFEREARATAELKSPHTVDVYDFGVADDGRLYCAMELLDGLDLDTLVRRFGPQPPARVVHWLRQACHSLEEAHARKLVHRDIKPANLMVCRYGEDYDFLKVLDFGLVVCCPSMVTSDPRLTASGRVIGTPSFMSPELATTGEVDARADLYALGCVAYWLLTGELVFKGGSPIEVLVGHVERPPAAPSTIADQPIPAALDALVLACLAKRPEDRPASAAELNRRLGEALGAPPWTQQQARAWWAEHAADLPAC